MENHEIIKEVVQFTHKRDPSSLPIIETNDFVAGVKFTLKFLESKGIDLKELSKDWVAWGTEASK